ncbi:hypothetical protein CC78DRAFT_539549 [Lojkania enalia]|uniref:RRM domain-containing protein n=1 Tax=Lojkania enalia TaxID=147567 RepID=A0A9P4TQT6_9PLEO|nr:hypothetical protein CC78DRAFT_539549 [Didymosphaeria enalia]
MPGTFPPPAIAHPRNREQKLFQFCLDSCIHALQNLDISQRRVVTSPLVSRDKQTSPSFSTAHTVSSPFPAIAAPQPSKASPPGSAISSPPLSLQRPRLEPVGPSRLSGSLIPQIEPEMDPSPGGRPPAPRDNSRTGKQDTRSNLAVQPTAAPAGNISLKKKSIKMIGLAPNSLPKLPPQNLSVMPVPAKPKEEDRVTIKAEPVSEKIPRSTEYKGATTPQSKPESTLATNGRPSGEASLATKFASLQRLRTTPVELYLFDTPTKTIQPIVEATKESYKLKASQDDMVTEKIQPTTDPVQKPSSPKALVEVAPTAGLGFKPRDDLEQKYVAKAAEYLDSLPTSRSTPTAHLVKTVTQKLRAVHAAPKLDSFAVVKESKRQYIEAAVGYLNDKPRKVGQTLDHVYLENLLTTVDADFLQLCAKLADEGFLSLEDLDDVVGLCKALSYVSISKEEDEAPEPTSAPAPLTPSSTPPGFHDLMEQMSSWPTQEKRENIPGCHTVILNGIYGLATVNKAQALVWGGRLESISVDSGKNSATVKFLTAEACQKYYDATGSGVKVPVDGKKFVVLVERQPAPNSTTEVIRNCIEGDASRCVRVLDADEDWADAALKKLAEGTGKVKRELDCIKRGRTARERYYIEFRFSNIRHALNFKQAIMDDVDWESSTITYGQDPCEAANGVHFED